MVLEYTGINNYGKILTIRREVNIDEAFDKKLFKAMYVFQESKTLSNIKSEIAKKPSKSNITEREELVMYVSEKMQELFEIETRLSSLDPALEDNKHLKNKKA